MIRGSWALVGTVLALCACASGESELDEEVALDGSAVVTTVATIEAETMSLPGGTGQAIDDANASAGKALLIWSNASATATAAINVPVTKVVVRARGESCQGAPRMVVNVNGQNVLSKRIYATAWTDYTINLSLPAGSHALKVSFNNDNWMPNVCDRNLLVDTISFRGDVSQPPPPAGGATPPPGYYVHWADEFDDLYSGAPNHNWWDYRIDYVTNNELQCFTDNRRENVRVETRTIDGQPNGVLVLQLRKESWPCKQAGYATYGYTSGGIITRARNWGPPKVEMPFGRYEIRAKLPKGKGTWPAVWLVGESSLGAWPNSGEIDIMEQVGFEEAQGINKLYSTLHKQTANGNSWPNFTNSTGMGQFIELNEPVSTKFHIYRMDWEPGRLTFYVDGNIVGTRVMDWNGWTEWHDSFVRAEMPNTSTPLGWPFAMETPGARFDMIVNLAWGGGWGGMQGIDDSIFSQGPVEMLVDYVRIYKKY
jgi:predicted xylan-binding protein with Ca-dependent carbohydrate-binding module/glycosyl hydrolase family 16